MMMLFLGLCPLEMQGFMCSRFLVADDHELVRTGLCSILDQQIDIEVVAVAGDGRTAVQMAREMSPDVIILDVTMPIMNGLDATRLIMQENGNARIIVLSMHHAQRVVQDALASGASAYVPKDSGPEELLLAVRAVAAGQSYLGTRVTKSVTSCFLADPSNSKPSVFSKLSAKEREVLQLLAEGQANKEIAAYLHVSARTVEAHRAQIMEKLDIRTLAGLTRYAIQEGLTPLDI